MIAVIKENAKLSALVSTPPESNFRLLSAIIGDRSSKLKARQILPNWDLGKLARLYLNLVKAVNDLEQKGFAIQALTPEGILVHEESGGIRILLHKSTIQKTAPSGSGASYSSFMIPTLESIRYSPPEALNMKERTIASCSWAIGVIM